MRTTRFALVAVILAALATAARAQADAWPARAITVVVGFGAGGNPDVAARLIAERLGARLGQPVVVENRPGAAGTVGAAAVARAQPDGYTLLFGVAANLALAPATMKTPPYEPARAFQPIAEVARGPYVWMVRADLPLRTMPEFVAWAKERNGGGNYVSPGTGSAHHLGTEMMLRSAGIEMVHVPTSRGIYVSILAGAGDAMFDTLPAPLAHIKSGKLRALGVTGAKRLAALPEVPTLAEQGLPDVPLQFFWGLVGPAGLPRAIVDRLHREVTAILAEPAVQTTFAGWGIETSNVGPDAFGASIAQEVSRWREFVARSGLRLE